MTFGEHFKNLMRERGQPEKQITLALVNLSIDSPEMLTREITKDDEQGMKELADLLSMMGTKK